MNQVWNQVNNFGFPIVVSLFLLLRVEKKLDELTAAILKLEQKI